MDSNCDRVAEGFWNDQGFLGWTVNSVENRWLEGYWEQFEGEGVWYGGNHSRRENYGQVTQVDVNDICQSKSKEELTLILIKLTVYGH